MEDWNNTSLLLASSSKRMEPPPWTIMNNNNIDDDDETLAVESIVTRYGTTWLLRNQPPSQSILHYSNHTHCVVGTFWMVSPKCKSTTDVKSNTILIDNNNNNNNNKSRVPYQYHHYGDYNPTISSTMSPTTNVRCYPRGTIHPPPYHYHHQYHHHHHHHHHFTSHTFQCELVCQWTGTIPSTLGRSVATQSVNESNDRYYHNWKAYAWIPINSWGTNCTTNIGTSCQSDSILSVHKSILVRYDTIGIMFQSFRDHVTDGKNMWQSNDSTPLQVCICCHTINIQHVWANTVPYDEHVAYVDSLSIPSRDRIKCLHLPVCRYK